MKKVALLLVAGILMGLNAFSTEPKDVDPVGVWVFSAPDAPYGYNAGEFIIEKEKKEYKASLKFGEYVIKGYNVKYEKNKLSCTFYIESEAVMVKATFSKAKETGKEKISGFANTSEGDIPFTAKRKPKEKK